MEGRYNYQHFKFAPYKRLFGDFLKSMPIGSEAPDFACTDTEGRRTRLSDYRGRSFVVLEFGCITCAPAVTQSALYSTSISRKLVSRFAGKGVEFLMVYTREAHPGERTPGHRSFREKMEAARRFKKVDRISLRVLVDGLDGRIHRKYGLLPNMVYIVDKKGNIAYKASWTDAGDVGEALSNLLLWEKGAKTRHTVGMVEKFHFIKDDNIRLHSRIYARGGEQALREIREELGLDV